MWHSDIKRLNPPKRFYDWLTRPYQLAPALAQVCQNLSVKVLFQGFEAPLTDERAPLMLPSPAQSCYCRKVYLCGDEVPWVYARTVIPRGIFDQYKTAFESLGNQLLGKTLLYNNPATKRSAFEYAEVEALSPLYPGFKEKSWARRSVFYLDGRDPILVTEVFLSEIPRLLLSTSKLGKLPF